MQRQGANKEVSMSCYKGNNVNIRTGYSLCYYKGKTTRQHRLNYCLANNLTLQDIKGKVIRHTCDNRWCVNPEHLLLGTHQDNMDDMTGRDRQAKGTRVGNAVLTDEQVRFIRENYVRYSKDWNTIKIAAMLGVSHRTVQSVTSGERWGHVEDLPCSTTSG